MIKGLKKQPPRRALAERVAAVLAIASAGKTPIAEGSLGKPGVSTSAEDLTAANALHLNIGCLVYPEQDQIDFTGPFEVLSRIPNATMHVIAKERTPIRDVKGLILTPEVTIAKAPRLDLLLVPGGFGQQSLMDDQEVLSFIKWQADSGRYVFSVCTGALLCGAAGILRGRRATTHWAAFDLLRYFGAIPTKSRVVVDGNYISTSGVTAGLDGALTVASILRGDQTAQEIQLEIEYAPDSPFHSGTPETAPPEVLRAVLARYGKIGKARETTASRIATRLGIGSKS